MLTSQEENREGFVVRFASGRRVKVKFKEYARLHKLLTGVSELKIWNVLSNGQSREPILTRVPDEYFEWVRSVEGDLNQRYLAIESSVREYFDAMPAGLDRRQQAAYLSKSPQPGVAIAILDGKPYSQIIWRMLRPADAKPFRCGE